MIRWFITATICLAPLAGYAQGGTSPAAVSTPGPTASPATSTPGERGTAAAIVTTPQTGPATTPVPATQPSGAPPDVMITPK